MSEWKPIETAPRDGTEFLAYDVRVKKMDVCTMREIRGGVFVCFPTQYDGELGPFEDDFWHHVDDVKFWRPLPEGPE